MLDTLDILMEQSKPQGFREDKHNYVYHDSLNILRTDVICHHGILGMKWGVRRFQPYGKGYHGDGKFVGTLKKGVDRVKKEVRDIRDKKYREYDTSYQKAGSKYARRTKYTNIDGSLNEKGKFHSQDYITKQIKKNSSYYDKQIKKYNKRAEEYPDDKEMREKFLQLAEEAEETKNKVNESIKRMNIDDVLTNETLDRENAIKAVKVAAGVTVGAAGGGLLVGAGLGISNALQKDPELKKAAKDFDIKNPVDSLINLTQKSEYAAKAESALESAIRTYSDARAYVLGIGLDQAMYRLNTLGVPQSIGRTVGSGVKTAQAESGLTPEFITSISSNFAKGTSGLGRSANEFISNPQTISTINSLSSSVSNGASKFLSSPVTTSQAISDPQVISVLSELNNQRRIQA